ncbi:MAG: methyltransferase domain-containing protein [Bacillota bacterium]
MPNKQQIIEFYSEGFQEENRLLSGLGVLEKLRMEELLRRFLPTAPAVVYDVGGATGVHSFWLAERGYEAHLLDIVPRHIELAQERTKSGGAVPKSMIIGDACKLPYADASADAVLLFGPLYHMTEQTDRLKALREAYRVLKSGGVLLAYGIMRYASLIYAIDKGFINRDDYFAMISRELEDGEHRKPESVRTITDSHFHLSDELRAELENAGFVTGETVGIQGPCWMTPDFDKLIQDAGFAERALMVARQVENEPALSPHFLSCARKR